MRFTERVKRAMEETWGEVVPGEFWEAKELAELAEVSKASAVRYLEMLKKKGKAMVQYRGGKALYSKPGESKEDAAGGLSAVTVGEGVVALVLKLKQRINELEAAIKVEAEEKIQLQGALRQRDAEIAALKKKLDGGQTIHLHEVEEALLEEKTIN